MLGSLAGIGEIAKATFGDGRQRRRRRRRQAARAAQADRAGDAASRRPAIRRQRAERAPPCDGISDLARTMWHWLIAAAIFFVLELVAPGTFMLWLGLSAMLVGVISFFVALAVAVPARRLRGVRARLDPAVAARRAPRREAGRPAVPQSPRRRLRRPRVHAGEADRRRQRHGADRRHDLAARRAGRARPAAASRSCAPTPRRWWWSRCSAVR